MAGHAKYRQPCQECEQSMNRLGFSMPCNHNPINCPDAEQELDMALAVELQSALMPADWTIDAANYRATAMNRMCGCVGGDFCDFIRLNSDQVAIAIGDVAGRGVRASLLMARIMGFLRRRPAECSRPTAIVRLLNDMLLDLGDRTGAAMGCSLFYVVLDSPSRTAFFVNDHMPTPILTDPRNEAAVRLGLTHAMLGVERFEPQECCHTFEPGQRLTLCSDGVLNAADPENRHFGEGKLEQVLMDHADSPSRACAKGVFEAIDTFRRGARQRDDETILVVDRL